MTLASRVSFLACCVFASLPSHPALAQDEPAAPSETTETKPASEPPPAALPMDTEQPHKRGPEFLYLKADAGFSYVDMASFSSTTFAVQKTSSYGPMFGVGAGLRLAILTLGVNANLNELSDFNLWQLDAELGLHIPSEHWDVYLGIHGGYAFVGTLDSSSVAQVAGQSPGGVSIYGGDAGLQLGADYYFNHFVSLGFELAGSALFLHRPPAALPAEFNSLPAAAQDQIRAQPLYANSGDSVGAGAGASLHLGIHL
jgi:hypothetical protein